MANRSYETTTITTHYMTGREEPVHVQVAPVSLDLGYLRTLSGMVKCIAIALDFICFICLVVVGPAYFSGVGWGTFVSTFGLTISLTLLCLYLFRIVDMLSQIPWILCEMVYCFTWTIFFFIAGSMLTVAATRFYASFGYGAAAFFAFGAMCTYGFDCYLKFLSWRADEIATGGSDQPTHYIPTPTVVTQKRVVINEPYEERGYS